MIAGVHESGFDLLLTPTLASRRRRSAPSTTPAPTRWRAFERAFLSGCFTAAFNATGQPAISLPLHWSEDGLPIGVQLVAPLGREDLLLRVAAQLEQAQPWADRRRRSSPHDAPIPCRDERDPRRDDGDGDALRRGGARSTRPPRGGSPPTWSSTARTASSSPASTGEAATLDDEEHIALLRAVVDEVGDEATVICGTGTNDTRHSVELTKAAAEAGADGGAGRHALLQQAQPGRHPRPLRGDRRRGPRTCR